MSDYDFSDLSPEDAAKAQAVVAERTRYRHSDVQQDNQFQRQQRELDARQREIEEDPRRTPEQKAKAQLLYMRSQMARSRR